MDTRPLKTFLDTHSVVFLYEGESMRFGSTSRELLSRTPLFYSPIVRLELQYLFELKRISVTPDEILGGLMMDCGISASRDPFEQVIAQAMKLDWTRDPFDRMIVASAALHQASLVTRDRLILAHYPQAVW